MKSFKNFILEAKATYCGRCGTTHVAPKDGGTCPAVEKEELDEANYRIHATTHSGEKMTTGKMSKKDADSKHYDMTKATDKRGKKIYKSIEVRKESVEEAYKDMTPAERDAFAQKIGDRARAAERSKKVSSMGAYRGRRVRKEEAELEEQFVIHKNGKPLKIKGKEVTTTSQQSAQKAIDTMMKQPFNKDAKFTIVKSKSAPQTTRPRDPNAYKRYTMQRKRIPDWRYAERGE